MTYDFTAKLAEADSLVQGRHYAQAVNTTGGILEALLKRLYQETFPRLPLSEQRVVQDTAEKLDPNKTVLTLTLGQLVGLFRESRLMDKAERALKRDFPYLKAANFAMLVQVRNKATHEGSAVSKSEAERFLSEVRLLVEEAGYLPRPDAARVPSGPLRPWRYIIHPHPDVQSGRYQQAEFAANLTDVRTGRGSHEYTDTEEFFRRTYLTAGMRRLLVAALQRLAGRGEAPVVQLKTAFGGGKTHTLIALYHLLKHPQTALRVPVVRDLVEQAGGLPPQMNVAVIVGQEFSPTNPSRTLADVGIEIYTLWGEVAAQLGGLAAYQLVQEADVKGVAPGGEVLRELLAQVGPSVILMDELVAFMRAIEYPVGKVRAGAFNTNLTFLQSLTEAVRATPTAMLIASIPESDLEAGGPEGRHVLNRVEKVFGRIQEVWQPVEVHESFEIVRRRLFDAVSDEAARDAVVAAFGDLYRQNVGDFPLDAREGDYLRRMRASYPIHPEVFDRLYDDWASLERFQRTRGVLRLMAKAIHELWTSEDQGWMILPGSLPVEAAPVRGELTGYLGDQWNSVVDADVNQAARDIDTSVPRMQTVHAARRLARTIFLGSVPDKSVKGIEDVRIKLGVAQPNEPGGLSVYVDALQRMRESLTFLYTSGQGRYWFGVQANLNRTVADRIHRLKEDEVLTEMEKRIRAWPTRDRDVLFAGVHLVPPDSERVDDADRARLVVLSPRHGQTRGNLQSDAVREAQAILENRGPSPRRYRNMLLFLAADASDWQGLEAETRRYLAWNSVYDERSALLLEKLQIDQALKSRDSADKTLDDQLKATYRWLLTPYQEGINPVEWEATPLIGSDTDPLKRASQTARTQGQLILNWNPTSLQLEFDQYLWKAGEPHISLKTLWQQLATYPYLSRLRDQEVLKETIASGAQTQDYFGYATGYDPATDKYQGLHIGRRPAQVYIDDHSLLVRRDLALAVLQAAAQTTLGADRRSTPDTSVPLGSRGGPLREPDPTSWPAQSTASYTPSNPTRFYGRVDLDALRLSSLARQIADEILQYLTGAGRTVTITLEIQADIPDGADDATVRTVTENAHTLKFKTAEFE